MYDRSTDRHSSSEFSPSSEDIAFHRASSSHLAVPSQRRVVHRLVARSEVGVSRLNIREPMRHVVFCQGLWGNLGHLLAYLVVVQLAIIDSARPQRAHWLLIIFVAVDDSVAVYFGPGSPLLHTSGPLLLSLFISALLKDAGTPDADD